MRKIADIYGELWDFILQIIDWIMDGGEKVSIVTAILGGLIGLFSVESLYFSEAQNVRLLFVILIAPVGAGLGAAFGFIFSKVLQYALVLAMLGLGAGISAAPPILLIYALYIIIVHTN